MEEKKSNPAPEGLFVSDAANAPIIYFDSAPTFGNVNGVINVTIVASRHLPQGGKIVTDVIAVGSLRCSIPAAIDLRNAIDQALLLGAKTEGGVN
jgi:hypothetical protein